MVRSKPRRKAGGTRNLSLLLIGAGLVIFALVITLMLINNLDLPAGDKAGDALLPASLSFPAPELSLEDLEGNPVTLNDYHGQIVLVNNWATWCPPCRAEMPVLNAYYQEHASAGFVIVAVDAGEGVAEVQAFAESMELSFPVWLDPQMDTIRAFRNNALPSSYVIDREGNVVLAWSGAINRATLDEYITPLLEN